MFRSNEDVGLVAARRADRGRDVADRGDDLEAVFASSNSRRPRRPTAWSSASTILIGAAPAADPSIGA
jgi:hypothetical protein